MKIEFLLREKVYAKHTLYPIKIATRRQFTKRSATGIYSEEIDMRVKQRGFGVDLFEEKSIPYKTHEIGFRIVRKK